MNKKLYVMIGIPGSGKSTYAKTHLVDKNTRYVSRDEIRFSLIKEDEDYFSKEDEVFETFLDTIRVGLASDLNIIADATHLNPSSRMKLLASLYEDLKDVDVIGVFMRTPVKTCIARNEMRKETRSYVPPYVINSMAKKLKQPTFNECNGIFSEIIIIDEDKMIKITEQEV